MSAPLEFYTPPFFFVGCSAVQSNEDDSYKTPVRESNVPYCGSIYEPECDTRLQPSLGMVFDSWEQEESFYNKYAQRVGFSVRKAPHHKGDGGVIVWKRFFSKQGWRKETQKVDEQSKKRKRKVKLSRCGCVIGFKRKPDGKYVVVGFIQSHTHLQERRICLDQT